MKQPLDYSTSAPSKPHGNGFVIAGAVGALIAPGLGQKAIVLIGARFGDPLYFALRFGPSFAAMSFCVAGVVVLHRSRHERPFFVVATIGLLLNLAGLAIAGLVCALDSGPIL